MYCVRLGVKAFNGSSQDQIIERLFNVQHNGRGWREREASALANEIKPVLPAGCACFVAEEPDSRIIGFVTATSDHMDGVGRILNLAVATSHHSRGIGRALINTAVDWMRGEGMAVAKIETLAANAAGRWLYPACGFTEVVRQVIYAQPLKLAPDAPQTEGKRMPLWLSSLHAVVERSVQQLPPGSTVSWRAEQVGVGSAESTNAAEPLPIASAIKVFLMAALFKEHTRHWDTVPAELPALLEDSEAVAMWNPRCPEWQACA